MKYANGLHAGGAVVVILYSLIKIFHFDIMVNPTLILISGLLLAYAGQSLKVRILQKEA
jgi:hypothetical protein